MAGLVRITVETPFLLTCGSDPRRFDNIAVGGNSNGFREYKGNKEMSQVDMTLTKIFADRVKSLQESLRPYSHARINAVFTNGKVLV